MLIAFRSRKAKEVLIYHIKAGQHVVLKIAGEAKSGGKKETRIKRTRSGFE